MARRIVVTGTASGIGAAVSRLARERGDQVIGVDRHEADVVADLSTREGRLKAVEEVRQRLEGAGLDAVVACAGLAGEKPETVWVNYFGVVEVLNGLREPLTRGTDPRAAVIGSIAGTHDGDAILLERCLAGDVEGVAERIPQLEGNNYVLYPTSKAALARWVRRRAVRPEWAGAGIALNAVAPGTVKTPMTQELLDDEQLRELVDAAVPMPFNGHAEPEDVARLLLWLVSAENTHVTGQIIYIDGGAEAVTRGEEVF